MLQSSSPSVWKVPGLFLGDVRQARAGTVKDNFGPALSTVSVCVPLLVSATVAAGLIQAIFPALLWGSIKNTFKKTLPSVIGQHTESGFIL